MSRLSHGLKLGFVAHEGWCCSKNLQAYMRTENFPTRTMSLMDQAADKLLHRQVAGQPAFPPELLNEFILVLVRQGVRVHDGEMFSSGPDRVGGCSSLTER